MTDYQEAVISKSKAKLQTAEIKPGSFRHLCVEYFKSDKFKFNDLSTRNWQRRTLESICQKDGSNPVALMASRVPDLGGVFSGTTPRASLTDARLHIQILRGPAWIAMPAWMVCGRLGLPNRWLRTVDVAEVECDGHGVFAQADGEPLGQLPISLRVVDNALNLLMP